MKAIQVADLNEVTEAITIDTNHHHATIFQKHCHQFYLKLAARDSQDMFKLFAPYKLCDRYLYKAYDCTDHSDVTHMCEHLSSF